MRMGPSSLLFFVISLTVGLSDAWAGRMVVFGDSLSDGGTYTLAAQKAGGGKFTTNPGPIWDEIVAQKLGYTLTPNRYEGYGVPLQVLGGTNYAQGGARIQIEGPQDAKHPSARPVTEQVEYFAHEHDHFDSDDLVFVLAGANDIFAYFGQVVAGTTDLKSAEASEVLDVGALLTTVTKLELMGAKKIVVLNLPAIDQTPFGLKYSADQRGQLKCLVDLFNETLASALAGHPFVQLINVHRFDESVDQAPDSFGFKTLTQTACVIESLPGNSSLFCSSKTLREPGADQTYKYADNVHPTTGFSRLVADFVLSQVAR